MKIKVIVPFPLDQKGVKNREKGIPKKIIAPGVHLKFVPVKNSAKWLDSYYDDLLGDFFIFEEGIRAEEEGYDAVCIDTMSDSGMYALRSRLNIPVISPCIVNIHVACILGHKFSIVTMWDRWLHLYKKNLQVYGLEHKCASLRSINQKPDLRNLLAGKESETFKALEKECKAAIEKDGADVIILGSTTMHESAEYLSKRLPVPVLNPGVVSFKFCEMCLQLGLSHSKTAFPTPIGPQDETITKMATDVMVRQGIY